MTTSLPKAVLMAVALLASTVGVSSAQETFDRTALPIAEPKPPTYSELDARTAKPPARFEVKAPKGAPNVVIVLIDDIGFGGPSTFGGPIRTPTMDQLAQGGLRTQFSHVIDIAPTVLEAAGLPQPKIVNGTPQTPIEGTSLLYTFNNAKAPERHTTQYFEMFGNRAIYDNGWLARTIHRAPWQTSNLPPLTSDVWELYDVQNDFSLTRNLAAEQPTKLREMQALFMQEAQKYHVLPIDDRTIERTNAALAGRPDVLGDRTSLTLYEGMQGMLENTFMNIKNRSSTITADLDIPAGGASGAILSQGGRFGGWSLYMKDGKPAYTYNFLGLSRYTVVAPEALVPGPATVTLDFAYDGGGVGKGGKATLSVNGKPVAEGRVEKTQPNIFSADETADVGVDNQTPVAEGIGVGAETRFTGQIKQVTLEVQAVQ